MKKLLCLFGMVALAAGNLNAATTLITASTTDYVKGGKYGEDNQDGSESILFKGTTDANLARFAMLRFAVTDEQKAEILESTTSVTLDLYLISGNDSGDTTMRVVGLADGANAGAGTTETTWDTSVTWNSRPDGDSDLVNPLTTLIGDTVATTSDAGTVISLTLGKTELDALVAADTNNEITFLIGDDRYDSSNFIASLTNPSGYAVPTLKVISERPEPVVYPYQANGIKVGEASSSNAVVWTRLTSVERPDPLSATSAAPGVDGEVQVTWWPDGDDSSPMTSGWEAVDSSRDYTHQFTLNNLLPGTQYRVKTESRQLGSNSVISVVSGQFKTAPEADAVVPVLATVVTGQGMWTTDSVTNGHKAYLEMLQLQPDFFVHTGDVLYYDREGGGQELSKSVTAARQRWNRMFSFAWNQEFSANIGSYFIKDDHDTLKDDCWPGQTYGSITFAEGVAIFKEQTPSGPLPYKTVRWGKDLQIWLPECREYRDANTATDGPDKSILGETQKAWLKSTIQASDATFKVLIAPDPFVGPDKPNKKDNHANTLWQTEGDELRQFLAGEENTFVVCGDRHWQYASIDPVTELREYCCGPINVAHAQTAGVESDPDYHSFFAVRGGYLSLLVDRQEGLPQITFRYHDIDDTDAETGRARIAYEETLRQAGFGLVTLTRDHIEQTVDIKAMTRYGHMYAVETSTNLVDWVEVQADIDPRGALLTYSDATEGRDHAFYRIVERAE